MKNNYDDDLFAHSTMTFGEHLEELRSSLFKAALSLFVGFLFGLYVGPWVVNRIQDPLSSALQSYYGDQTVERFMESLRQREKQGESIPPELKNEEAIRDLVFEQNLLFEEVFVSPDTLLNELRRQFPERLAGVDLPTSEASRLTRENMLRIFLWHKGEEDDRVRIKSFSAQEPFVIYLKAAFVTGAVVSSPLVFYFLWSFVAAGLYPHEKKYVHIFLPFSLGLFLLGASLAFFFVFPPVLQFFFSFNAAFSIDPDPRISDWLSFVLMMPLAFGISFQLPLVMLFLERIGIFTVESYMSKWKIAVLVIAVLSMLLSPGGDPYSMMMMMVPLIFLYFGGVWLCRLMPSNRGA